MPDKKPEWSDYSYDNKSIAKRLGISREEVEGLKAEAAKKSAEESVLPDTTNEVLSAVAEIQSKGYGVAGVGLGVGGVDLGFSVGIPGIIDIDYNAGGDGKIDLLKVIKIEVVRIKCFYIQRFYLGGQFLYSDIQRVDSEECKPKEPEPEPEPEPPPGLDTINEDDEPPNPSPRGNPNKSFIGFILIEYEARRTADYQSKAKRFPQLKRLNLTPDALYDLYEYTEISSSFGSNLDGSSPFGGTFTESFYVCYNVKKIRSKLTDIGGGYYNYNNRRIEIINFNAYRRDSYLPPYGTGIEYWMSPSGMSVFFVGNEQLAYWRGDALYYYFSTINIGVDFSEVTTKYTSYVDGQYQLVTTTDRKPNPPSEPSFGIVKNKYKAVSFINLLDIASTSKITDPTLKPFSIGDDMNDCCRIMRKLAKYQGLGDPVGKVKVKDNEIKEKGGNEDIFPLEVPKRWFDRKAKPTDKTEIKNMRHLLLSIGTMLDRFEELFNPAGKDSAFPLKKPETGIWKWLPGDGGDYKYPDPNFEPKKSKEDGKIGLKDLKIETYLDLFRYFLESQIRLEMLFPIAQIQDSKISKRLIYPKAPGQIKINDMIQLQELLLLYLNKTLGDPSAAVIVKDADPTKEGDQPLTIENFDLSDMLRKLIRFSVDINSDVDLSNNFGKRTLYQLLSAMQVLVKNYEMTEAIFEDLGMKEEQAFVPVKFFADPYAGAWKAGEGFDPNRIKVENTETAIEENLEAFLQEKEVEVKVSRRAKDETTDLRDLLGQIGRYAAELAAQGKIPNTPEAIQQAIDKARFELQTESALRRTDVRQASAAGRVRTKRNKKKQ